VNEPPVEPAAPCHVTVCICTYRRPAELAELLRGLAGQRFSAGPRPLLSVVVTDNEGNARVEALCKAFHADLVSELLYRYEPRRGISHARNTCLEQVPPQCDFVALIDDDEIPAPEWLDELLLAQRQSGADAVIGPVTPVFDPGTPAWIRASGLFDKPRQQESLANLQRDPVAATCNALLSAAMLRESQLRFSPHLALSGGEDALFFRQLRAAGYRLVWASAARVYEPTPAHKANLGYVLREEFRRGNARIYVDALAGKRATRWKQARGALKRVLQGLGGMLSSVAPWRRDRVGFAVNATRSARGVGMLSGLLGMKSEHYR
jgi:glycosyltransferase involved in cell wall biosynthesis